MNRFWDKVKRGEVDECWPWQRFTHKGYGRFGYKGKTERAHRVAWRLIHGDIPKGLVVCHKCDNQSCCNPIHLYLGTMADNIKDRDSKGRGRPRGRVYDGRDSLINIYKDVGLTKEQGLEISGRYLELISSLAKEYGATMSKICDICDKSRPYLIKTM